MNTNPMTIAKCPRCGSTAQVREEEFEQTENGLNIKYSCGCGARFVRVYELVAQFTLKKEKAPNEVSLVALEELMKDNADVLKRLKER
jgi:hypothetical protein